MNYEFMKKWRKSVKNQYEGIFKTKTNLFVFKV